MPPIKRWFPVSHDINSDAEVWAMRRQIGEKSLSIWLEFLSIADRNDGLLPGDSDQLIRSIAGRCQATVRTVTAVYQFAISRLWLNCQPTLRVSKYEKYHRTRELIRHPPDLPDLPNYPKEKKKIAPSHRNVTPPAPWPSDDLWLSELLKAQWFCSHCAEQVQDYQWWEFVAKSFGGIDRPFIEKEFAKINAWWRENPTKRKTANGMKRFLRTWLEKAKNDQGRMYVVKR